MLPYGVERTGSGNSSGFRSMCRTNVLEHGKRYGIETSLNSGWRNAKKAHSQEWLRLYCCFYGSLVEAYFHLLVSREFWRELFLLLGTKIKLTSTYHPQSNGSQEKFNKTLIEALRTYVSHRQDNWDECILFFEFAYNNSVNPSTGHSPFIL